MVSGTKRNTTPSYICNRNGGVTILNTGILNANGRFTISSIPVVGTS